MISVGIDVSKGKVLFALVLESPFDIGHTADELHQKMKPCCYGRYRSPSSSFRHAVNALRMKNAKTSKNR